MTKEKINATIPWDVDTPAYDIIEAFEKATNIVYDYTNARISLKANSKPISNIFRTKMEICCNSHGIFKKSLQQVSQLENCPLCVRETFCSGGSKGVMKCVSFFKSNNIDFKREYTFDDCRNVMKLRFDFCIKVGDKIGIIEYNGQQHYIPGFRKDAFERIQTNDQIKREYLKKNNIPFLDIAYTEEDQIDDLLWNFVSSLRSMSQKVA